MKYAAAILVALAALAGAYVGHTTALRHDARDHVARSVAADPTTREIVCAAMRDPAAWEFCR